MNSTVTQTRLQHVKQLKAQRLSSLHRPLILSLQPTVVHSLFFNIETLISNDSTLNSEGKSHMRNLLTNANLVSTLLLCWKLISARRFLLRFFFSFLQGAGDGVMLLVGL